MRKLLLTSFNYLLLSSIIEKAGSFLIIPILTKNLTPNDYGSLVLAVSYAGFLMLFIYNGLHSALFRWYSLWEEDFDKRLYEKYIFFIITAFGFVSILFILIMNFFLPLEQLLAVDILLLSLVILSNVLNTGFVLKNSVWVIDGKAHLIFFISLVKTSLLVIGVFYFIRIYPYAVTKPILENIIIGAIFIFFLYLYLFRYPSFNTVNLNKIWSILKKSFIYGWGLQISQLAFWVISSSDRIMLGNMLDKTNVAYYSILMIGTTPIFVVSAFNNSFTAHYNKMISKNIPMKKINDEIFNFLLIAFFLVLFYKLILFIFSKEIIHLISTEEYLIVSKYLPLTADILLFYFMYLMFTRFFHAHNKVKIVVYVTTFSAAANIFLNFFLIKGYAYLGALIASIIAYFLLSVLALGNLIRYMQYSDIKKLCILTAVIIFAVFSLDYFLTIG